MILHQLFLILSGDPWHFPFLFTIHCHTSQSKPPKKATALPRKTIEIPTTEGGLLSNTTSFLKVLLLPALKVYGRKWKKIEHYISTRTSTQIRSHAQKYFIKLHKLNKSGIQSSYDKYFFAGDQKPEPLEKVKSPDSDLPTSNKKPFLITMHNKNAMNQKKECNEKSRKKLDELDGFLSQLETQFKDLAEKCLLAFNLNGLMYDSCMVVNSLNFLNPQAFR